MGQLDKKQIAFDFDSLPTKQQVSILYDLVLRLIANDTQIGLPITDPVLLQYLPTALAAMSNQLNQQQLPTPN